MDRKPVSRECGDCVLCCKLLGVAELNKPSLEWCQHCKIGVGCKIYEERPETCRSFECLWLKGVLDEDMKPSKSKAVFWISNVEELTVQVHIDVGRDWRTGKLGATIESLRKRVHVCILQGEKRMFLQGRNLPMPDVIQEAIN